MSNPDDFDALMLAVTKLGQEFADRSQVEIAIAVLDAADHAARRARFDQAAVERSARHRLSTPMPDGVVPFGHRASDSPPLLPSSG
jgi:hypothetical protein